MEKYYNLREVAKMTGYKSRTLREWIKQGRLVAKKLPRGRLWLVSETELRRLIDNV